MSIKHYTHVEYVASLGTDRTLIGQGSSSEVMLGRLPGTQIAAAVKQFREPSTEWFCSFVKEVELAQDHPHIVHLYGYCQSPLALYYEYMDLGSLEELLDSAKRMASLSFKERLSILLQVGSGLAHLHG